ncbi:unnamed protein product, partial [Mesorhabditis belari]|uniref:ELMO domain-containing protein n=1 Tax=Mesorhabditis belari TaxID=2138241 RepID=A0AAF3J1W4_9BILA
MVTEEMKAMAINQQNYFGARLIKSCVCRPGGVEALKSAALNDERLTLLALSLKKVIYEKIFRKCTRLMNDNVEVSCDRSGGHWETIGFQGADPSTDLRSAGMLGLLQLHSFVTRSISDEILDIILKLAQDKDQNFPFAVVGINFTALIIERLKNGTLNEWVLLKVQIERR